MAELVNKINGPWFSKFDEDLATAFSIYCGISIAHVCAGGSSTWRGSHTRWGPSSATAQRNGDGGMCVWGPHSLRTSGGHRMGKEFTGIRMCCGYRVGLGLLEGVCPPPALP